MDWRALPSLSSLRAFAAVAETESFSRAGQALNVSQAAVSQQIRALEGALGSVLVIREGRGIALTPAGRDLARVLQEAFAAIECAVGALTEKEAARPLQVSPTPMFATNWLMPRVGDFCHQHPEFALVVNPTAQVVDLALGGIDVAIRFGEGSWPGVQAEPLILTDYVIVAARSLIGTREITDPSMLLDYPWVQEQGVDDQATAWLAHLGVASKCRPSLTNLPGYMGLEAALRGQAIVPAARALVESDIEAGRLVVLFTERRPNLGYHIVTRPGVMRPALKALVAWLRHQRGITSPGRSVPL